MSETWQIFIIGFLLAVIQALLVGILGWLAWELRQLRRDVGYRIHLNDCNRRMEDHSKRIEKLEGKKWL